VGFTLAVTPVSSACLFIAAAIAIALASRLLEAEVISDSISSAASDF